MVASITNVTAVGVRPTMKSTGVEIDRGETGDELLAVRDGWERADVAHQLARLVAIEGVGGHDVE
jgi:hypothetical protein